MELQFHLKINMLSNPSEVDFEMFTGFVNI